MWSAASSGATPSALQNFCSSLARASVRSSQPVSFVALTLAYATCHRGGPNTPHVPVSLYDRDGLPRWWRDPVNSLLFHPNSAHCAHLLVHLHRHRFAHLWRCQGEGYWRSRQGGRWVHMGCSNYVGRGGCSGRRGLCHSCPLRGEGMSCLTSMFTVIYFQFRYCNVYLSSCHSTYVARSMDALHVHPCAQLISPILVSAVHN